MNGVGVLTTVWLCVIFPGLDGYINNFRFKHSNVFKGDVLPLAAKIYGSYYVDLEGTPELTYVTDAGYRQSITATQLSQGHNDLPVVCVGKIAGLVANLTESAHERLSGRLRALEAKITKGSNADVQAMIKDWDSYVDVSQPEYECSRVALTVAPNTEDGYLFNVTVTFKSYTSIVFVDALGVGMFSYQRSYDDKTTPDHEVGNPIRFCGGVDYTGDMYTAEPRPKCPTSTASSARHHGRALITVYKPNIVSIRRDLTKCAQHLTRVTAITGFFNTISYGGRRKMSVRTTPADCRKWRDTKNACETFKISNIAEGDVLDYPYYSDYPDECKLESIVSQNQAMSEYQTKPDLSYLKNWMGTKMYEKRSATLSEGDMEVSMPTASMVSPWVNIPPEYKYAGEYEFNNITYVWEPFADDDLCQYVPRFRGEVAYIKYKQGDYNSFAAPEDEDYTLFLIADEYGALFYADSSNRLKNVSMLNCMPHKLDYRTSVYQTGSEQLIMVTVVDEGRPNLHATSHIPEEMRHVGSDHQAHDAFVSIHVDPKANKVTKVVGDNPISSSEASVEGSSSTVYDLHKHYNNVKTTDRVREFGPTQPPPTPPPVLTDADIQSYIEYQHTETQKHNLHIRALQGCFMNQLNWDVYMQLLDVNPSRAIGDRLNVAVEASLGGNGFYNVKRCELATNVVVVPTLRTNSKELVTINGEHVPVKDILTQMGIVPDPEKCISMPLVVFTSPLTGAQVVGQLNLDGIINVDRVSYIEACARNKAFIFLINNYGHFFFDYIRNFTEPSSLIRNATQRFLQSVTAGAVPTSGNKESTELHKQHILNKIHTITIVQPSTLKEKEYNHYPTGLFSNNLYSVAEIQSVSLGLMKLMEEQNYERFAATQYSSSWSSSAGGDFGRYASGSNFMEGFGDFFLKVGEGGGDFVYGIGKGIGAIDEGIGKGVGAAAQGVFGGIGDALSGTFMSLGIPLIAIAVLAIVGVIIYKQLTGKKSPTQPPPYEPRAPPSTTPSGPGPVKNGVRPR